jgi:hypothetical protein
LIYCDSEKAIGWVKSNAVTDRTKHFEVRLNMCRQQYAFNNFELKYISGKDNPADMVSKQLGPNDILKHCGAIGMERLKSNAVSGGLCQSNMARECEVEVRPVLSSRGMACVGFKCESSSTETTSDQPMRKLCGVDYELKPD